MVESCLDVLETFQNQVLQAKLFDLPPGTESFRAEQHEADVMMLLKMLQKPEHAKLRTGDIARVFLAEAVDCHERCETIAQAWFCSAMLVSAAAMGALDGNEVPEAVRAQTVEADRDLGASLWRWTPCTCVKTPPQRIPWTGTKTAASQLVKEKRWAEAVSCYEGVLATLAEVEVTESALLAVSVFDSRGPVGLHEVRCERARVHSNISLCRLSSGDAEAALEAALAAAEADPTFAKGYARQVLALEALGRPALEAASAAVRCAQAARENPSEYEAMRARHSGATGSGRSE